MAMRTRWLRHGSFCTTGALHEPISARLESVSPIILYPYDISRHELMTPTGTIPTTVRRYLEALQSSPWQLDGERGDGFAGAVVVPSLAECANLFRTLHTLAKNPAIHRDQFLVVVVVNHREDASSSDKADNLATLHQLPEYAATRPELRLAWVDAALPGRELPLRSGGVGLARKIGFDLALTRLGWDAGDDPLLIALDADTLVRPDYLPAIRKHFRAAPHGGAVIPFRHQEGESSQHRDAILLYELFLRSYVLGLSLAGSPYAFHTVGSAMACTASSYARMGGMNSRKAGEDFYFLQQLWRTSGISPIRGTIVYPSARSSHRVPFGTGRAVSRYLLADPEAIRFYNPDCFRILGEWLSLASRMHELDGAQLVTMAESISPHLADYLRVCDCGAILGRLKKNHPTPDALQKAFHDWFDALKTMKLIHHLSEHMLRCSPADSIPALFARAGIDGMSVNPAAWLELLRDIQGAGE